MMLLKAVRDWWGSASGWKKAAVVAGVGIPLAWWIADDDDDTAPPSPGPPGPSPSPGPPGPSPAGDPKVCKLNGKAYDSSRWSDPRAVMAGLAKIGVIPQSKVPESNTLGLVRAAAWLGSVEGEAAIARAQERALALKIAPFDSATAQQQGAAVWADGVCGACTLLALGRMVDQGVRL